MSKRMVFTSATLYDGVHDKRAGMAVAVEGQTITAVDRTLPIGKDDLHIDLGGKTLMPGMTVGHWHGDYGGLRLADVGKGYLGLHCPPAYLTAVAIQSLGYALASGVTNVVGAACNVDNDAALKLAMADGRIQGPRIRACGLHINTTGNENDPAAWWLTAPPPENGLQIVGTELFADGPEGMRKAVRHQLRRGVEVIKVFPSGGHGLDVPPEQRSMSYDELAMVIRTAHEHGAIVRGHVSTKKMLLESIRLGMDIVDHGDELDEEVIEAMLKHGTFYVPSMLFLKKLLPTRVNDLARDKQLEPVQRSFENLRKMLPVAHAAGVKIVPGDDFGLEFMVHAPGVYAEELEVYVQDCGIDAKAVLGWATCNGGQMMGRGNELGTIRPGYVADLLVVDGDPGNDIAILRHTDRLKMIVKQGQIVKNELGPSAS
jgi:imidazolonepropionase-like amidohydrolase